MVQVVQVGGMIIFSNFVVANRSCINSTPLPFAVHYKLLIALDYIYKESYIIPRLSAMYTDRH